MIKWAFFHHLWWKVKDFRDGWKLKGHRWKNKDFLEEYTPMHTVQCQYHSPVFKPSGILYDEDGRFRNVCKCVEGSDECREVVWAWL